MHSLSLSSKVTAADSSHGGCREHHGHGSEDDDAEDIHASGTHLLDLITTILDISKAEAKKLQGEPVWLDPRPVLELVDHVAVSGQRQSRIMTELASHVDDAASFVQEERSEAVAQVVWTSVRQTCRLRRPIERPPAPRLVSSLRPGLPFLAGEHKLGIARPASGQPALTLKGV